MQDADKDAAPKRWTEVRANEWYSEQPWLVGCNYAPASASNQLEMWQPATFNPKQIDQELGWAAELGMNTVRVFLHDLLWEKDPEGFKTRIDTFLSLAEKHGIKPLLVLFDSVWDPNPKLGPQQEPVPGVHNSRWVQGPGAAALQDPSQRKRLQEYVEGVVGAFGKDSRVLGWDVWNEPDNTNASSYGKLEPENKIELVAPLLSDVFKWARSQNPDQPLISGVWIGEWDDLDKVNAVQKVQLEESDLISFHNYAPAADFERRAKYLMKHDRPLLCTEYMARPAGSTFEDIMPVAKKHNIGLFNWGFVQGRTQTHLPWDSWQKPYASEPPLWFHEILRQDGTPYIQKEVDFIKSMTGVNKTAAKKKPSLGG